MQKILNSFPNLKLVIMVNSITVSCNNDMVTDITGLDCTTDDGDDYGNVVITTMEAWSHKLDSVPQALSQLIKMSGGSMTISLLAFILFAANYTFRFVIIMRDDGRIQNAMNVMELRRLQNCQPQEIPAG